MKLTKAQRQHATSRIESYAQTKIQSIESESDAEFRGIAANLTTVTCDDMIRLIKKGLKPNNIHACALYHRQVTLTFSANDVLRLLNLEVLPDSVHDDYSGTTVLPNYIGRINGVIAERDRLIDLLHLGDSAEALKLLEEFSAKQF